MTPKHANCPALPMSVVSRAFSFSLGLLHRRSAVRAVPGTQKVSPEIHNMNALDSSEQAHVHIMNFGFAGQKLSRGIHIMNFINSKQVEPPSIRWKPVGASKARVPSTYKGSPNVMS